ncbi:hypothetical protein F1880_007625 [Penicillium rolfsii]|nr:hypothetical protein F1880_007625 [Penicillium rolfsii]
MRGCEGKLTSRLVLGSHVLGLLVGRLVAGRGSALGLVNSLSRGSDRSIVSHVAVPSMSRWMDQELGKRGMLGGANGWQGKVGEKGVEKVRGAQVGLREGRVGVSGNGEQPANDATTSE